MIYWQEINYTKCSSTFTFFSCWNLPLHDACTWSLAAPPYSVVSISSVYSDSTATGAPLHLEYETVYCGQVIAARLDETFSVPHCSEWRLWRRGQPYFGQNRLLCGLIYAHDGVVSPGFAQDWFPMTGWRVGSFRTMQSIEIDVWVEKFGQDVMNAV